MWAQANLEGNQYLFMDKDTDYYKNADALELENSFIDIGQQCYQK
jgi:hypothetical protein